MVYITFFKLAPSLVDPCIPSASMPASQFFALPPSIHIDDLHLDLLASFNVKVLNHKNDITKYIESITEENKDLENNIYVYDLGTLHRTYQQWEGLFPGVAPYYAVKCNPDMGILKMLAFLGSGFDCASPAEIDRVLAIGVDPSRIIYANPCKREADIRYADSRGIIYTTFDTLQELNKIARCAPSMKCILRLFATDPNARCQLSNKFGAPRHMWVPLMERARQLGLPIVGISFHVGSGACTPSAFSNAIEQCRELHDLLVQNGFTPQIIDIGGGFMKDALGSIPAFINDTIASVFPSNTNATANTPKLHIIAEPGRFFAESCGTLVTKIIGVREHTQAQRDYWITDSIYGSFNCKLYDHIDPKPCVLSKNATSQLYSTTLFGPTCDGMDTVLSDVMMPYLDYGDWIYFDNMGAYTISGASHFNGIPFPNAEVHYVYSQHDLQIQK